MHSFKFFVSVAASLVVIFTTDNEVTAAPHPCLWMLDYEHSHKEPTTTTTAKPEIVEQFINLKQKNPRQLEKLVTDWIIWGPRSESETAHSRNPMEKLIAGYVKFMANIFNML